MTNRERDDFYETPPDAVIDLISAETFHGPIWEPACGRGAISKVLEANGYEVVSTDLVARGYGRSPIDFLLEQAPMAPNVITNPPFKLAEEFVRHARRICPGKIALLLKLAFLEGLKRADLFRSDPPARVWVFSRRIACTSPVITSRRDGIGGGMLAFAWFVWEGTKAEKTITGWL
ncbi:MAG: hypothetical protein K0Q60_2950 [Microvirga sp.]|jgi:hypothetical protein|nr:hypothetical protein [Microvirga sp.]